MAALHELEDLRVVEGDLVHIDIDAMVAFMLAFALEMTVSVRSPRKSILRRPMSGRYDLRTG